ALRPRRWLRVGRGRRATAPSGLPAGSTAAAPGRRDATKPPCPSSLRVVGRSDLQQLGFLVLEHVVDLVDVLLREDFDLLLGAGPLVLTDVAVLDRPGDGVHRGTTHVAHRDLGVLTLGAGQLDVLLATVLGQLRHDDTDGVAVGCGVVLGLALAQHLLAAAHGALVARGAQHRPGVVDLDRGQLPQRGRGTVVVDHQLVEHGPAGAAGPDGGHV